MRLEFTWIPTKFLPFHLDPPGSAWIRVECTGQGKVLHNDPQRVITTRWGLSLPFHLPRQPHRPSACNASHINHQRVSRQLVLPSTITNESPLGITTGNPWVNIFNPYPTRTKPLPATTGMGFQGSG